jgi:hypothetical protein
MGWFRESRIACRLVGRYWYAPWRSPVLRWRMETYGITDAQGVLLRAEEITARRFVVFCWTHRRILGAFLAWAAELESSQSS